jgi:hypothetical protein
MRFLLFVLVIALTLMVAGSVVGRRTKKPAVAAAPAAPAETRAPRHPAPPDKWLLSENGLGPVRIDERPEQVGVELGEPFLPVGKEAIPCVTADWPSEPEGVDVAMHGGKVSQVTLDASSKVRTDLGIGIGDDMSRVLDLSRAAGREVRRDERNRGMVLVLPAGAASPPKALMFLVDGNNRVFMIRAGFAYDIERAPCE